MMGKNSCFDFDLHKVILSIFSLDCIVRYHRKISRWNNERAKCEFTICL